MNDSQPRSTLDLLRAAPALFGPRLTYDAGRRCWGCRRHIQRDGHSPECPYGRWLAEAATYNS